MLQISRTPITKHPGFHQKQLTESLIISSPVTYAIRNHYLPHIFHGVQTHQCNSGYITWWKHDTNWRNGRNNNRWYHIRHNSTYNCMPKQHQIPLKIIEGENVFGKCFLWGEAVSSYQNFKGKRTLHNKFFTDIPWLIWHRREIKTSLDKLPHIHIKKIQWVGSCVGLIIG